jgi:hypothetical protein
MAEKAQLLRAGNQFSGQMRTPQIGDVSLLSTLGPFTINPRDSLVVAQAIVFGMDSAMLHNRALAAKRLYQTLTSTQSNQALGLSWHIYPNPANQEFTVVCPQPIVLRLMDGHGRLVAHWALPTGQHTLPLGQLPAGLYVVQDGSGRAIRLSVVR